MQDVPSADNSIIPTLIKPQTVNLLGGQSGIGKTRFLLPQVLTLLETGLFLDIQCPTVPIAWLMCDRRSQCFHDDLQDFGLASRWTYSLLPVVSAQDYLANAEDTLVKMYSHLPATFRNNPAPKLLIIEAFQMLMDEGNSNSYRDVYKFFTRINAFLAQTNCAILGTVHSPKSKPEEGYLRTQERVLGSVAWSVCSYSIFFLENVTEEQDDLRRLLRVEPHSRRPYTRKLDVDFAGLLVPVASHAANEKDRDSWRGYFDTWLGAYAEEDLPAQVIMDWMDSLNVLSDVPTVSRASVYRWIDEKCRNGILSKSKKGVYKVRRAC